MSTIFKMRILLNMHFTAMHKDWGLIYKQNYLHHFLHHVEDMEIMEQHVLL